ncbi:MAG: bacterial transcriptional activator domain-containing protein [Blastocatellia bacterium]|nr:bacterial transcriptional activator domain-containing protein [Blastocatellia bacterium]
MTQIHVRMLGKLEVRSGEAVWEGPANGKTRELFCFLLAHSRASFSREQLAAQLWADCDACHSRKNLRQVLWRLQAECETALRLEGARLVLIQAERLSLNPEIDLRIDVRAFEDAFAAVRKEGRPTSEALACLGAAVESYHGDFLSGCYQDWCLFERERLQVMLLAMLDRLIADCLDRREYDAGIRYGQQLLQYDPASERTHRQLMNLHYLSGDRSAAIRQYERCAQTLKQELGVAPEASTTRLYEQFRSAAPVAMAPAPPSFSNEPGGWTSLPDILSHLREFQTVLSEMQRKIHSDIQLVEKMLPKREENS